MVYHTKHELKKILREEFVDTYEEKPDVFDYDTRIYSDLHADEGFGRAMVLEWMHHVAKRLSIDELVLQKTDDQKDYTIGEIVEILRGI